MKTYSKKLLNIFLWLFIISIPVWLIMSEATKSDLLFYIGFAIIIIILGIGSITKKF